MVDWVLSEMGLRLARGSTAAEKTSRQGGTNPLVESRKIWDSIRVKGTNAMATPIFSLIPTEQQAKWDDIMGQMCAYVNDTNADIDMAYDWVCEMLNISSFVDNETAWNSFYDVWESCDNRNDLNTFQIV